jgi:hypothetical protein
VQALGKKMKIIKTLLASISLVAISTACLAQEEDAPEHYSYSTYYECSGPLSVADEAIAGDVERLNGLIADGSIKGWGWIAHHTGGQWSRIFGYSADSLDGLLDAGDAINGDDGDAEDADAADDADDGPTFNSVCTRHDDYIWRVENGMSREARGAVGFGVYLICDNSKEDRADEIVDEHVAPILNALVEEGALTSWGWLSHIVGGKYRRLQTMTATDHKSLLAARGEAISAIYADDNEMGEELNDICYSHVDYIWDIVHEYR